MQLGYSLVLQRWEHWSWSPSPSVLSHLWLPGWDFHVQSPSWYNKVARVPAVTSHSSHQKKRRKPLEGSFPFSRGSWSIIPPTPSYWLLRGLCHLACELQEELKNYFLSCSCELWGKLKLKGTSRSPLTVSPVAAFCLVLLRVVPSPATSYHVAHVYIHINGVDTHVCIGFSFALSGGWRDNVAFGFRKSFPFAFFKKNVLSFSLLHFELPPSYQWGRKSDADRERHGRTRQRAEGMETPSV